MRWDVSSASDFKLKLLLFSDTLIQKILYKMVKIQFCRGELTDISAKKEALDFTGQLVFCLCDTGVNNVRYPQYPSSVFLFCRNIGRVSANITYFQYLEKMLSASTYPSNVVFDFENKIAGTKHSSAVRVAEMHPYMFRTTSSDVFFKIKSSFFWILWSYKNIFW